MKCSLHGISTISKILLLIMMHNSVHDVGCVLSESKGNDILSDFDYLISQLYLQHCTFVEIGEGVCSLFVELTITICNKPQRKQMFLGNCLCSEFHQWHLCSVPLSRERPEDCKFQEGTSCPSSSARVHRRLCDVTGMSQWNMQCNCSVTLAGQLQDFMCGFKTCYASPMPNTICGPRTVCGTAHCAVGEHGSLYSVRCDRRCRHHQPFCENPCSDTSLKRVVTSQWAEWRSNTPADTDCSIQQYETECLSDRGEPALDCLGPGLLCCGKDESDCTCEVKMQDGKLKAFRYMIKFGDIGTQTPRPECEANTFKRKVRSSGIKGDAQVWSRLIAVASIGDKNDSVSMFGNKLGVKEKYNPLEHQEVAPETEEVSMKITESSQELRPLKLISPKKSQSQVEKSNENINMMELKATHSNKLPGGSDDGKVTLVNKESQQTPEKQAIHESKDGFFDIFPLKPYVNTVSNKSKNSSGPINPNQQKERPQINRTSSQESQYRYTSIPVANNTSTTEDEKQNFSNGQTMTDGARNTSEVIGKSISSEKSSDQESEIINKIFKQNAVGQNESLSNLDSDNQNIEYEKPKTDHNQENIQKLKGNASNESVFINNQSKNLVEKENNLKNISFEATTSDAQSELKTIKTNSQTESETNAFENQNGNIKEKEETAGNNTQTLEVEHDKVKEDKEFEEIRKSLDSFGKESKDQDSSLKEGKTGAEKSKENMSNSEKVDIGTKAKEYPLGGIIRWNKAKGQENSLKDDEEKAEFEESNQQGMVAAQHEQNHEHTEREKERMVTPKAINQNVSSLGIHNSSMTPSSESKISTNRVSSHQTMVKLLNSNSTEVSYTTKAYTPMSSLLLQSIAGNNSNSTKSTTENLQNNFQNNLKEVDRKNVEQNSKLSVINGSEKTNNISQTNTTNSASSPTKDQSSEKPFLNTKLMTNDIANLFPNNAKTSFTAMSTNLKPRPNYFPSSEKNEVTVKIQTVTTSDLLGSIAKRLFKSQSQQSLNDQNDPFRMLSESNPSIKLSEEKPSRDYDEPEPVLKDLNKVDRDNVDEKMAEALSKLADVNELPGKVEWKEKSVDGKKFKLNHNKKRGNMGNLKHTGYRQTLNGKDGKTENKSKLHKN